MCRPLAYGESRDIIGRDDVVRRDRAECSANAWTSKRMVPNTVVGERQPSRSTARTLP